MSPPTRRPLGEIKLPLLLTHDMIPGPRVWITDSGGRQLALVDRPVAEFMVDAINYGAGRAA